MGTIEKKIENVWVQIVGGVARFEIFDPMGSHVNEKGKSEKNRKRHFFVLKY